MVNDTIQLWLGIGGDYDKKIDVLTMIDMTMMGNDLLNHWGSSDGLRWKRWRRRRERWGR